MLTKMAKCLTNIKINSGTNVKILSGSNFIRNTLVVVCVVALSSIGSILSAQAPSTVSPSPPVLQPQPPTPAQPAQDAALQQAINSSQLAANAWLQLVDQGNYAGSWEAGALPLRLILSQREWIKTLNATRKPLGRAVNRQVADIRVATDPKGLAKGNYMVFMYDTSFSGGHLAKEIVTLQQTSKGEWRVLTYLISVKK